MCITLTSAEMLNPWQKNKSKARYLSIQWKVSVPKSTASHTYRHTTHIEHWKNVRWLAYSAWSKGDLLNLPNCKKKNGVCVYKDRQRLQRKEAVCALSAVVGGGWWWWWGGASHKPEGHSFVRGERETPGQCHSDPSSPPYLILLLSVLVKCADNEVPLPPHFEQKQPFCISSNSLFFF